ncbi:MAG TPA: ComEC/Rec2 family competence protein, partial [Caldilineaceae bacterium]|nr:ComEC/Rec2 family competence protein [Caldilineaceae bacterium]
ALLGIGCYALLVGGDAAVLRASCMGGLCVVAAALGRRSTALVSLSAACWVMTLVNPLTLWDVGFQLSSAATAGLILFTPGIEAAFKRLWSGERNELLPIRESVVGQATIAARGLLLGLVLDSLITTLAANVTTLPLVIYYFGRLSVVSLLTNLAVAPVQSFIMLWGTLGLLVGVAGLPWLAWLLLLVPWLSLVWTVTMVRWTAALPGASLEISSYNEWSLLLTYLLIATLYICTQYQATLQQKLSWLRGNWQARLLGPGATVGVGACTLLLWSAVGSLPDGRLHVYFLDVGQGDGIFIQTPSGRQVLIDGGPSPEQLFNQLGAVMPFWDRTIDLVTVTNPDKDHMDAQTQMAARFQIGTALQTAATVANHDADLWRTNLTSAGAELQLQHRGGWIDLGDGVALWVLWPPIELFTRDQSDEQFFDNENSLVMKLTYGDFSVLLTGDAGIPAEFAMIADGAPLASTVLKAGHHGSSGSTSAPFVRAVNPQLAVIQVGADNAYGHPRTEVLENLNGRTVLRNDLHGRIHLYSDGQQMWFDTERN